MAVNKFNLETEIPQYKLVKITQKVDSDEKAIITQPLIMDDDFSISVDSSYGQLWQSSPNNLMNLLSSSFGLPSGQFSLQGAQIWQSTEPLKISFQASLEMDRDSYTDVVEPSLELMKIVLPTEDTIMEKNVKIGGKSYNLRLKTLIPPGPNLQAIMNAISDGKGDSLSDVVSKKSGGLYNVRIGFVKFNNMIVKKVEPNYSKEVSFSNQRNAYYPIKASLRIEMETMKIPTQSMIQNAYGYNQVQQGG